MPAAPIASASAVLLAAGAAAAAVLPPSSYEMLNGTTGFGNYRDTAYAPDPNNNANVSNGLLQGGTGKLSDGLVGSNDIFENNFAAWVGWYFAPPTITFKYNQPVAVDGLRLHAANFSSVFNDVSVPASATITFLDAGNTTLASTTWSAGPADTQSRWLQVFAGSTVGGVSSVRVQLTNGSLPWIFLSEVEVTGVPAPSAAGLLGLAGLAAARRRR